MSDAPNAPSGLGGAGEALWNAIVRDLDPGWHFDARELHLLQRACRCADDLEMLEQTVDAEGATVEGSRGQVCVHPCLVEARQLRLVQLRLLSALEMADPRAGLQSATPAQSRARNAANKRWNPSRPRASHG